MAKSDGSRIAILFDYPLLGVISQSSNSNWIPSSFEIDFEIPRYTINGIPTQASKSLIPDEIQYMPVVDENFDLSSGILYQVQIENNVLKLGLNI